MQPNIVGTTTIATLSDYNTQKDLILDDYRGLATTQLNGLGVTSFKWFIGYSTGDVKIVE